jgi:hypothetical protein
MPKIALVLVFAATAIIAVLAAAVLGNIVPLASRPRPDLLAGLERSPAGWNRIVIGSGSARRDS